MKLAVGRSAQRDDADIEASRFERLDFLGDEGLRKARIAFQDKSHPIARGGDA